MFKKFKFNLYLLKIFLFDILNILSTLLIFIKNNLISLEDKSNIVIIRLDALWRSYFILASILRD